METIAIAKTAQGCVQGEETSGVLRFRGIPFADSVAGAGRFAPPRPPRRWQGVRAATTWAHYVPQVADAIVTPDPEYHKFQFGTFYDAPMSEDGLFLNLWTPSLDRGAKRPVMVWLHGGGFTKGTPTRPREEASMLSRDGDVVVVAPSHRLGAFGYLYLDDLTHGRRRTANLGMLDIVAALRWIAENVENFGGDPGNVTVFGESGGGKKASALLAMPAAKGLLHRCICQGGVFARGFGNAPLSREEATDIAARFLGDLGIGWNETERLSSLSMQTLIASQEPQGANLNYWRPVIDGEVLPCNPADAVADGSALDVPMIVGCAAHEADLIFRGAPKTVEWLEAQIGPVGRDLFERYSTAGRLNDTAEIVNRIVTDWAFTMPALRLAEAHTAAGRSAYVYNFDWTRPADPRTRATHGAENPFVFGTLDSTGYTRNAPEANAVRQAVQGAWLAFARSGSPNGSDLAKWPPYGDLRTVMIFDGKSRSCGDLNRGRRLSWSELPPQAA